VTIEIDKYDDLTTHEALELLEIKKSLDDLTEFLKGFKQRTKGGLND